MAGDVLVKHMGQGVSEAPVMCGPLRRTEATLIHSRADYRGQSQVQQRRRVLSDELMEGVDGRSVDAERLSRPVTRPALGECPQKGQ